MTAPEARPTRFSIALWLVVLAVGVAVFLAVHLRPPSSVAPVLAPQNTDAFMYHLPMRAYAFQQVRAGALPVWNPYAMAGQPFLATHQHAVLYPGNLPHWWLPPARALGVVMGLHVWWAALGMFVWLGFWEVPPSGRALGALVFGLASCVVNPLQWPHVLLGNAWLPWVCAGIDAVVRRPDARRAAVLGLACTCLLLAGYIQGAVYIYYAALPYALLRWWQGRDTRSTARAVALVAGLGVLPLLCAAVQLLPMVELARYSARTPGGLNPAALGILGYVPGRAIVGALVGRQMLGVAALTLTVGPLAWMLAAAGVWRRPMQRALPFWLALGALAGALSVGFDTPLYRLYFALPTGSTFRLPVRLLVLTAAALAVCVGCGAAALSRGDQPRRTLRRGLPMIAVACVVAGLFVPVHPLPAAASVVAFLVWLLIPAARRFAPVACAALLTWGAVRAYAYPAYLPWHGPDPFPDHSETAAFLRANLGHDRFHIYRADGDWKRWAFPANWGMSVHLRQLTAYESLPLQRVADSFNYAQFGGPSPSPVPFVGGLELTPQSPHPELLDVWSVRWIVIDHPAEHPDHGEWLQQRLGLERIRVGARDVLRNPHALPRAYWVPVGRAIAPGPAVWPALTAPDFDPRAEVLLESTEPLDGPAASVYPAPLPAVRFLRDDPTDVRLALDAPAAGWVVLADAWFPGWEATVNGAAADVRIANGVFRAVQVPAGGVEVRFRYRPAVVRWGEGLTLSGCFVLLACVFAPAGRRRS